MDVILAAIEAAMNEQQKKQQAVQPSAAPARVPPPVARATVAPQPAALKAVQPVQPPLAAPHVPQPAASPLQGMFSDGNSLLRAIIAAEVLGPPSALRQTQDRPHSMEQHFWNLQPNEPLI